MPSQTIQWFPGHMAKTRRLITENLSQVDIVIELLDARIPQSSKNPEIDKLTGSKPKLTLLTKASLADAAATKLWVEEYSKKNRCRALAVDTVTGEGVKAIAPAVREILAEKLQRYADKGMSGRKIRAMIVGIPNVGKSSLVNKLGGGKKAKVEAVERNVRKGKHGGRLVFVGDETDAECLRAADISFAMKTVEENFEGTAGDIAVMSDEPSGVLQSFHLSYKLRRVFTTLLIFVFTIKIAVFIFLCYNLLPLWAVALIESGLRLFGIGIAASCRRIGK